MHISIVYLIIGGILVLTTSASAGTDYNGDGLDDIAFHRPGGGWGTVPVLFANGDGTWNPANYPVPSWAYQSDVIAISGDYDGDGLDDIAFQNPSGVGDWYSIPVLFANGNGTWHATNYPAGYGFHSYGVVPVVGDYNGDGRDDIAAHVLAESSQPTVLFSVHFSAGNGSWIESEGRVPAWVEGVGVVAIGGDYNGDGLDDIAFHKPGGDWDTVPVIFARGNGRWDAVREPPVWGYEFYWAHGIGVVAVGGDYDGDGRDDIAFHQRATFVPVIYANGNGTWNPIKQWLPDWAHLTGAIAIGGDYNGDGLADIAFHKPGGGWDTIPVLLANGDGTWNATNEPAPAWANELGVVAVGGDYNGDGRDDIAFHQPGGGWSTVPVVFANGDGTWTAVNSSAPSWAHQLGVKAVQ